MLDGRNRKLLMSLFARGEGHEIERDTFLLDLVGTYHAELLGSDDLKEFDLEH